MPGPRQRTTDGREGRGRPLPQRVGPYEIDALLGRGGMGHVYRAYDGRLDRWVAIKIVRPDDADDPRLRERLRREARAAAGLSHPAIVQVHDLLEHDSGEAVVMELVPGVNLAERLARGPLPPAEAVTLATDVAEALAAAHAAGVLHRDLKAENVMVTPEGRAKVLDFGLARRLYSGEEALSASGVLVGTFRAMSPEQARSLPLDARSDLFSLGVLIYECLSGRSPFRGDSGPDTLMRICTHRQPPVRELAPGVPERLSALVDALLEKDPGRRPQQAAAVAQGLRALAAAAAPAAEASEAETTGRPWPSASPRQATAGAEGRRRPLRRRAAWGAAVLAVGPALAAGWIWLRPRPAPLYVAVPRPLVSAGADRPGVELLTLALRESLLAALLDVEALRPLSAEQVDAARGGPVEIARAVAAQEVLTSSLQCRHEACGITLSRVDGRDGALRWTAVVQVPVAQPLVLRDVIGTYLAAAYPERGVRASSRHATASAGDYEAYLGVLQQAEGARGGEPAEVARRIATLEAIRQRSPRFVDAYVTEAATRGLRYTMHHEAADVERALDLLAQARRMSPADPRPAAALVEVALRGDRLELAAATLAELKQLQPGDPEVWVQETLLLERQGRIQEAAELMARAAERHGSCANLYRLAQLEFRRGRPDASRRHIEAVLERLPGYHAARSYLAQIELLHGSPERAATLYAELVGDAPDATKLANLGVAQILLKRYADAEASFQRAVELAPNDAAVHLNLADALLLQGRRADAEAGYARVLRLAPAASTDWQEQSIRAQASAHLGRRAETVKAIQEVLRLSAESPEAAYDAALVYALLGDEASAAFNAVRSLQGGVEPRWFELPWFERLRAHPEVAAQLDRVTPAPGP